MKYYVYSFIFVIGTFVMFSTIKNLLSDKKELALRPHNAKGSQTLYDFKAKSIDGKEINFSKYKGKKVVIINVASKCGYTPQYADWQKFHKEHGENIVVLGFPANNFMKQEPGSNVSIAAFCEKNYGVSFQMFGKVNVTGSNAHPLYKWLSTKSLNGWNNKAPTWNFCKYLIDEEGNLSHFFASGVKPKSKEFQKAVGI